MDRRKLAIAAAFLAVVAIGGVAIVALEASRNGADTTTARPASPLPTSVPRPDFARVLPTNYRATRVWYQRLSGESVPEAIVTSIGPPQGAFQFHAVDLQVLSWDPFAHRWTLAFDAQRVTSPTGLFNTTTSNAAVGQGDGNSGPLLDRKANGSINQVSFAKLTPDRGKNLIFAATMTYGGSGAPGVLAVVSFKSGVATIDYVWSGDGGTSYKLAGAPPRQRIEASAAFWTPYDAHCCPVRRYSFTIAARKGGYIDVVRDVRPWVGLSVEPLENDTMSPVRVVAVAPGSPAASLFKVGDVLIALKGAPRLKNPPALGPVIVDQVYALDAGARITFTVQRGAQTFDQPMTLGSLVDPSAALVGPQNSYTLATF